MTGVLAHPASALLAARSAWATRQVAAGQGLDDLLRAPTAVAGVQAGGDVADQTVRIAFRALQALARLPGRRWRNTCLFRAIAECLVLRAYGYPAQVKLGVAGSSASEVAAHAWVECEGHRCLTSAGDEDDRYMVLR